MTKHAFCLYLYVNSMHASQTARPASDKLVCSCNYVLYILVGWKKKYTVVVY